MSESLLIQLSVIVLFLPLLGFIVTFIAWQENSENIFL